MANPEWLERMEHTADEGIVGRAATREELFARAAWGMFSVLTEMDDVQPRERADVEVGAADADSLMVEWLSELNFRHSTQHRLFCRFDVAIVTDERLTASVWGEAIDPPHHRIHAEIKAVTFCGLRIGREGPVWRAQILFDV